MTEAQWQAVVSNGASGLTAAQLAKFLQDIIGQRNCIHPDWIRQSYEKAIA